MKSLCGRTGCPRICVRVCHCPAGLARSHWLAGMYRNRREFTRGKRGAHAPLTPTYQAQIEFIDEKKQVLRQLRSKIMSRANWYHYHASITRSQALKLSWAEWKPITIPIKHNFDALNQPNHRKQSEHFPTHNWHQAGPPYSRSLRPLTSLPVVIATLIFIGLVVFFGIFFNQGNFVPDYEPPQYNTPDWR